ncbi:MAG: peptidoglycan DD-metalloendopeptidase family protein, partial [Muribaculaceae bacterium]|nr:peptidoglycan DD-metalloendopeptidase family protein [Muribaculaceae bacterium]
ASYLDGIIRSMTKTGRESRTDRKGELQLSQPFYRPVPGPITSRFGWRPAFQRVHHGVDLALQVGDTVRAAISGTVTLISYDHSGYGHYVVLTHPDGMETLYGHLHFPLVAQGQFIYSGQPVGIGGNTGNSTGPHLHFEARLGGIAVDPLILFDFYGIGEYLFAEETAVTAAPPKAPAYTHQQKSLRHEATYIVRYGDTMESVARQAGISVMRLCQLNMLNSSDALPVGRMLKLR